MNELDIDLLPEAARARVCRARASQRATRTALGLVLIGALATAGAEAARIGAIERLATAQAAAARTLTADETRARLAAALKSQPSEAQLANADEMRVPISAVLAMLVAPLPNDAYLGAVRFVEKNDRLVVNAEFVGADAEIVALSIRSTYSEFTVDSYTGSTLQFSVPRDRPFVITQGACQEADDAR